MPPKKKRNNFKKGKYLDAKIKRVIQKNIETKFVVWPYDTTVQDPGRTPLDNNLADISTGTTPNTRIGNQIHLTGLHAKFMCRQVDTTNLVRMVLYIPKDPTDTMRAAGVDYLEAIDLDRFTVLYDKLLNMNNAGKNQQLITLNRKFNTGAKRGIGVQYTGTTGTSIIKNKLSLYWVSDSGVVTDPILKGFARLYYKDA